MRKTVGLSFPKFSRIPTESGKTDPADIQIDPDPGNNAQTYWIALCWCQLLNYLTRFCENLLITGKYRKMPYLVMSKKVEK